MRRRGKSLHDNLRKNKKFIVHAFFLHGQTLQ